MPREERRICPKACKRRFRRTAQQMQAGLTGRSEGGRRKKKEALKRLPFSAAVTRLLLRHLESQQQAVVGVDNAVQGGSGGVHLGGRSGEGLQHGHELVGVENEAHAAARGGDVGHGLDAQLALSLIHI